MSMLSYHGFIECTQYLRNIGLYNGDHTDVIKHEEIELNRAFSRVVAGHGNMQQDKGTGYDVVVIQLDQSSFGNVPLCTE